MNELKPEDVMRALDCWASGKPCQEECSILEHEEGASCLKLTARSALALLCEKDAEIERLTKERDYARRDCAVAEQLHYECKKELEEMSDDILDSVRAERDRYKAESERYQSAMLKAQAVCVEMGKLNQVEIAKARAEAITEFVERMEKALTAQVNASSNEMLAAFMWCLDLVKNVEKKLKGATE